MVMVQCCRNGICLMPDAPWHGTVGGYSNHGCKCTRCAKEAKVSAFSRYHDMPSKIVLTESNLEEVYPYVVIMDDVIYIGKERESLFAYTLNHEGDYIVFESRAIKMPKNVANGIDWSEEDDRCEMSELPK